MKNMHYAVVSVFLFQSFVSLNLVSAEEAAMDLEAAPPAMEEVVEPVITAPSPMAEPVKEKAPVVKRTPKVIPPKGERASAFLAGPDWEFDGLVAGGQDSAIRSMFYLGDLVYLNIGTQQGLVPGGRVGIYKRGNKVKDPQTGKFLGFEVRRAAYARVSDKLEEGSASVRIASTFEPVEIGDLVRREE